MINVVAYKITVLSNLHTVAATVQNVGSTIVKRKYLLVALTTDIHGHPIYYRLTHLQQKNNKKKITLLTS